MSDDRVIIFDTTLRDGEQSPGISLDTGEKLEIAEQLARLGADYVEAGFPVASQGDFEAVEAIAKSVKGPVIAGLSRTHLADVDRCWDALKHAEQARIHVFISTSPSHMEHMLKMTPEQVREETARGVERARSHTDDVEFSPQDATRTPLDFMIEVLQTAVEAGATTLNIPDTVGYGIPWDFGSIINYVRQTVKGDYVISTHCHNDLGLAVANSLSGIKNGARQVEVCVNGLGERAGNAALEEVVMALKIRPDQFDGLDTRVNTEELARTSRLVSRLTGYPVQYNKAVVGRNAFAHESGIHQHGVLAERTTYEIIDASKVGQKGSQIVLGKHSGRHAFAKTLADLGYELTGENLDRAWARFRDLVDRKVSLTDADLVAIVTDEISKVEDVYTLDSIQVAGGTHLSPTATVRVRHNGQIVEEAALGDGMVDAACSAIRRAVGLDARLISFNVGAVTGGTDALGEVSIGIQYEGNFHTGRAVATDIVEGSARAYLNAINRAISTTPVQRVEAP